MGRLVVIVAAVWVGCGGSGTPHAATADPVPGDGAATADDGPPYPLIWSRSLPDEPAFDVFCVHVEPITGDVVVAGAMKHAVQMAGAAFERVGNNDGLVVRFDAHDGAQLWVTQIVTARALAIGSNAAGDTLVVGDYEYGDGATARAGIQFVAELDRAMGTIEWSENFGRHGPSNLTKYGAELLDDFAERHPDMVAAMELFLGVRLPDGALALSSLEAGLVVRSPDGSLRWGLVGIEPMSVAVEARGLLLVAGRLRTETSAATADTSETTLVVDAVDPSDGTNVWSSRSIHLEPFSRPRLSLVGDARKLIAWDEASRGETLVFAIDGSGNLGPPTKIPPGALTASGPDGAFYAVRGATGERELVKLGPCPVVACSIDAR